MEFYEVRALACNSTSGRSYEARIHLPRTSVNKGKKTAHIGRQWLTERRIGLLISSKVEQKGASRKLGKDGWGSFESPNHLAKPSHNHFYRSYFYGCIYSASTTWTQPFTKLVLSIGCAFGLRTQNPTLYVPSPGWTDPVAGTTVSRVESSVDIGLPSKLVTSSPTPPSSFW